jgi:hypothetical protein
VNIDPAILMLLGGYIVAAIWLFSLLGAMQWWEDRRKDDRDE